MRIRWLPGAASGVLPQTTRPMPVDIPLIAIVAIEAARASIEGAARCDGELRVRQAYWLVRCDEHELLVEVLASRKCRKWLFLFHFNAKNYHWSGCF